MDDIETQGIETQGAAAVDGVPQWQRVRYDLPADGVARITLARAEVVNAQDYLMLSELNEAFDRAARDTEVRVVILAADGKHFSSGHDLRDQTEIADLPIVGTQCHFDAPGAEGYMAREAEMYVGLCWRWRNLPKPTIAQVQGKVIAGGLMLVWPMDLIVCSEDATFSDPVVAFGVNGHEYFTHPFEVGARLAKDMLFTGRAISAAEALQHGMVSRVVAREDLERETLDLAAHIAKRPMLGLTLAKQSVNNTLDAMGMYTAMQSAFGLHHVAHNHNLRMFDSLVDPSGLGVIRAEA
jgi:enoyl-CoA hydratase